jgi:hypothetical protein
VVNDVLEEVRVKQPRFAHLQAPIDKKGAHFFVNQNSREPMSEPDEMVPLWKVFDYVGVDWTYASKGWAAENFCMFTGNDAQPGAKSLKNVSMRVNELGCAVWLNTECGHSYYTMWQGIERFWAAGQFPHGQHHHLLRAVDP